MNEIIWTKTDESPYIASVSLRAMLDMMLKKADIRLKVLDISLAGRILSVFNMADDELEILSNIIKNPNANIIKLPNISATISQLKSAIKELQNAGYDLPDYPDEIKNNNDKIVLEKYKKVLGSAVNPVLRDGNSDRRSTRAVKEYAKAHPHYMGEWKRDNKTRIACMSCGDFYANEMAKISSKDENLRIEFIDKNGKKTIFKDDIDVKKGDVIDASYMQVGELIKFYEDEIKKAKDDDLVFSLHLKASMMKVSDPVMFGHCLRTYFDEIFIKYSDDLRYFKPENGLKELFTTLGDKENGNKIIDEFKNMLDGVYMLDKDTSNFHVSSDVIIDASMPQLLRNSGKLKSTDGIWRECVAVIPDRSYAGVYQAVLSDFKNNGMLDVTTLGSVSNVGLMAKKAQEYGSHDKSFIAPDDGEIVVLSDDGLVFKFNVSKGDIFRMCLTRAEAISNWIDLAKSRAKSTNHDMIVWLDENRAVDRQMIKLVKDGLDGVWYEILSPEKACEKTLQLIRAGKDVISVSGNVLRDYLTDLFPILELGTSAKMLSVVPLLNGGVMLETGAGGTAPMLSRELQTQNHMIWDSLGEFLALNASLELIKTPEAKILATTLDLAISEYLNNNKSPQAQVGALDTRGSHFWLILYWLRALKDSELSSKYDEILAKFEKQKDEILMEFSKVQGVGVDFGGWYYLDDKKLQNIMRPSKILNQIVDNA
ncbi:NADP-dependent isocitrate dehydrogenase [Campylobacter majalis]|uniref:NADP-dependent isocitrate dehydrogenase n=1 Tax=Campylobacter majalis TaxID=2790656 RepID=UPI003D693E3C